MYKINDNGHDMKNGELWYAGYIGSDSHYTFGSKPQIGIVRVKGDKPYQQVDFIAQTGSVPYGLDITILGKAEEWPRVEEFEYDGKKLVRLADPTISGATRIARERQRQILVEGWDDAHDDDHIACELARAAAYYAWPQDHKIGDVYDDQSLWPSSWSTSWDKKYGEVSRVRQLEIAGALIAAEIDRLQRAEAKALEEAKDDKIEDGGDEYLEHIMSKGGPD